MEIPRCWIWLSSDKDGCVFTFHKPHHFPISLFKKTKTIKIVEVSGFDVWDWGQRNPFSSIFPTFPTLTEIAEQAWKGNIGKEVDA